MLHNLLDSYQDVILISDMYLPKEVILEMLYQVDPRLTESSLSIKYIGNQNQPVHYI